jgi:transcription-repair coupling factor (superfamily II helicase)
MKLVINRAWGDPQSRLNGLLQLTKGLSGIVKKAEKRETVAA